MWNIQICEAFICIGIPKHWRLSWFRYETFFTFLTFRVSTRGERDTISTMLTVPSDPTTRGLAWPRRGSGSQLASSRFKSQLTVFLKNHPKSSAHASAYSHPQAHFLSGIFIMTSMIPISSPREREHLHSMCAPNCALSQIVLSLTKPKDKI